MPVKRYGWDSPYWSTLYRGTPFVRTFEELDEWAQEERRAAEEREPASPERAGRGDGDG